MVAVILAGGLGTRFIEESQVRPKPMIAIGGKPILWHIMKTYSSYGIHEFIICCGFKGHVIKEYFAHYFLNMSDVTFDFQRNETKVHNTCSEPWKVTLVDTGTDTMTGGRLKRIQPYLSGQTFCMTYGDSVSNVDISQVIDFHRQQKALVTLVSFQRPGRFGTLTLNEEQTKVLSFREKPTDDDNWTNGGFFVIEPDALDYIKADETIWENEPLETIASDGMLSSYKHNGFLYSMDTLRDKQVLEELWQGGKAPWKVW